jgi:hypothetical protein
VLARVRNVGKTETYRQLPRFILLLPTCLSCTISLRVPAALAARTRPSALCAIRTMPKNAPVTETNALIQ